MKKVIYLMLFSLIAFFSCKKNDNPGINLKTVTVQLVYPTGSSFTAQQGTAVKLATSSTSYDAATDATGKAVFTVPVGIYEASATETRSEGGIAHIFNGVKSSITITDNWSNMDAVSLDLTESQSSQVVIKEVFVGGTPKDDGSGAFIYDRYVILYNNSNTTANLGNLCLATVLPYNSTSGSSNKYYGTDGNLTYASQGWIPAGQAYWYFQSNVAIDPGKQIVIALTNAVNNTLTYSKSINFDNAEYYAMYDIQTFANTTNYVTPAASIPTSHYLKAIAYGAGTAWVLSTSSPGFFIFDTKGTTPVAFGADVTFTDVYTSPALISKKVPVDWIVDGVEAFQLNGTDNKKRLTAAVDAGYVYHINGQGYSIYRNVDKTATEAIAENSGKIVYGYNYGTTSIGGATDPSGIDAEASIKNGAHIIYQDTNNSTNDFHLRSQASLRD